MHPHIRSVADMYAFNSMALSSVLSDLSDEEAGKQFRQGTGSSITFLVGHLLSSRVGLFIRFQEAEENPFAELFGQGTGAQDASAYPPLSELISSWKNVADRLHNLLEGLTEEQILAPAEGFPTPDQTQRGALMFLAWHESYHVGQIGMMRTEIGKPSLQDKIYEAMQKEG